MNWFPQINDLTTPDRIERTFRTVLTKLYGIENQGLKIEESIKKQVPALIKQNITVIQNELQVNGTAPLNVQDLLGLPTSGASTTTPGTDGTDINWESGVLQVPDASTIARGVVNTGSQTFGGSKGFLSIAIGSGTIITGIVVYSQSLTPISVAGFTSAEQTFTVTGLTTADKVFINGPTPNAGTGIVNVRVSAADTLKITFINATIGALVPTSGTYLIIAIRS